MLPCTNISGYHIHISTKDLETAFLKYTQMNLDQTRYITSVSKFGRLPNPCFEDLRLNVLFHLLEWFVSSNTSMISSLLICIFLYKSMTSWNKYWSETGNGHHLMLKLWDSLYIRLDSGHKEQSSFLPLEVESYQRHNKNVNIIFWLFLVIFAGFQSFITVALSVVKLKTSDQLRF